MKNMLKLILAACLILPSVANAVTDRYTRNFVIPVDERGNPDVEFRHAKLDVYRNEDTTVPALKVTGAGKLLGLCISGGAINNYVLALDSASVSGISDASAIDGVTGKLIGPAVLSAGHNASTSINVGANIGCWYPKVPAPFTNGLVLVNSAVNVMVQAWVSRD